MNKLYRISPSFVNLVVKNQPRSQGSLLPVLTDRRENLGTRLVKNKEEGGLKERREGRLDSFLSLERGEELFREREGLFVRGGGGSTIEDPLRSILAVIPRDC